VVVVVRTRKILCFGHRGARGHEPENTLRSIRKALELGADGIEIDVHLVGGRLVVIHDDTLDRTTNGRGRLAGLSFADLRRLDAGKGEKVPTLEEVMDETSGRALLNIELKGRGTALPVMELIERRSIPAEEILISSFHLEELRLLPRGEVRIGVLFQRPPPAFARIAHSIEAWSVHADVRFISPRLVRRAHEAGLRLLVYTVNTPAAIERMKAIGVDGVFSDYPDRVVALRNKSAGFEAQGADDRTQDGDE
jgi:glycerophosphoryl diester phosphodiesterase